MNDLEKEWLEKREQRQADVDRLAEIEGEVTEALVEPVKAIKKCAAAVVKAETILAAKRQRLTVARSEELGIRSRAYGECGRIEQRLKEGAVPGLREFIAESQGLWGTERHKWGSSDREGVRVRIDQIRGITARAVALYHEPDAETAGAELGRLMVEIATPELAGV